MANIEYKNFTTNIRILCAAMVEKAQSGHPGSCLGISPLLLAIYSRLRFDPNNPRNPNRDIFVLSNAHACAVQYVFNCLIGYLEIEDLKNFRQFGSKTPGHPEKNNYGIEITSEPLGQGVAEAVGFAMALKKLESPRKVYCVFGDGCYQEGITQEAFSIAAHLNLNNLIFIYDYNKMTIDGSTELSMQENIKMRFLALNFEVEEVFDENVFFNEELCDGLFKTETRPKIIIFHSVIGAGCDKAGLNETHGNPIGRVEIEKMKTQIGIIDDFEVLPDLKEYFYELGNKNIEKNKIDGDFIAEEKLENNFEQLRVSKKTENGNLAEQASFVDKDVQNCKIREDLMKNTNFGNLNLIKFKENYNAIIQKFQMEFRKCFKRDDKPAPTRKVFQNAMNSVPFLPRLFVGAADLSDSVGVKRTNATIFNHKNYNGDFVHFGVREHAMAAILNGMSAFGFVTVCATFLNFVTYAFPAIRLAALDSARVVYVLSHDSIGIGEDGPTHQPIEALALLRATPNLHVLRPCDKTEIFYSLQYTLNREGPSCIILTRQNVDPVENTDFDMCRRGAYFVINNPGSTITILASGSEVALCVGVVNELKNCGISSSLVSFLSFEIFDMQPKEYKNKILTGMIVSVEMLSTFGWAKYSQFQVGVDSFGKSGKTKPVLEHFGFTKEKIAEKIICFMENIDV